IARTRVTDLSVVAGMPLEGILLAGLKTTDLSPLLKCPTLKSIVLPQDANDVESLHALPNLTRLSYAQNDQVDADKTADQFWESHRAEESWLVALRKANVTPKTGTMADKSWSLTLDDQPIADLAPIKGANITRLSIMRTPVSDLSPIAGMKLTELWL